MEPMGAEYKKGEFKIHYKCSKCNHEFKVRCGKNDDREVLLELVK
jgi:hypothetical protein